VRPSLFVFTSVGRLGHDRDGNRTMTIEARKDARLPDRLFQRANPARIDEYHTVVARKLATASD
jgi:hypothetical protein